MLFANVKLYQWIVKISTIRNYYCSVREKCIYNPKWKGLHISSIMHFVTTTASKESRVSVSSLNIGKYGPEKTPCLDSFHAVVVTKFIMLEIWSPFHLGLYSYLLHVHSACIYQIPQETIKYAKLALKMKLNTANNLFKVNIKCNRTRINNVKQYAGIFIENLEQNLNFNLVPSRLETSH